MINIDLDPKFANYIRVKELNPAIQWDLLDQENCNWVYSDAVRIKKQLIDNIDLIQDKNIIDLACYNGILTQAMCQLGARKVTATDVRSDMIKIVNEGLAHSGFQNQAGVIYHDLYDLVMLDNLLIGVDTIHIAGVMFHVNHHYELLYRLSQSNATAMILDTLFYLPEYFFFPSNEEKIA